MVEIRAQISKVEDVTKQVNPIGTPRQAWILTETLHRRYSRNMEHEGGFEEEARWKYLVYSRESLDRKLGEIVEARTKEGWAVQPQSEHAQYRELTTLVGDARLQLRYSWTEEQVIDER